MLIFYIMSTSVLYSDSVKQKHLRKVSVRVSKEHMIGLFCVLESWKGWSDWPFSRGRQGSPFPRGLPTHYPTAMWAAPVMNPTGRASSVKEEEQQHCKPIVLQHHSQIISKTHPQSQRPEIHTYGTCTLNTRQETQNIVLSHRRQLRLTCKISRCLKSCARCAISFFFALSECV